MTAHFETFYDDTVGDDYAGRWRLVADDGTVLAESRLFRDTAEARTDLGRVIEAFGIVGPILEGDGGTIRAAIAAAQHERRIDLPPPEPAEAAEV